MDTEESREWDRLASAFERDSFACWLELARDYLRKWPENGFVWLIMGEALASMARYDEAEEAIQEGMRVLPAKSRHLACRRMGQLYDFKGDYPAAEEWYRRAVKSDPRKGVSLVFLGGVLAERGKLPQAKRCYRRAIKESKRDADEAYLNLGYVLRAEGRYREALECFERALELDPKYGKAKEARRDVVAALKIVERRGRKKLSRKARKGPRKR